MLSFASQVAAQLERALGSVDAIGATLAGAEKVNTWRAWLSSTERSTLLTLGSLIIMAGLLGLWRERSTRDSQ